MNTKIYIAITVLAAAFIASGCVSTGKFEKMEAGKNEKILTLEQQRFELEQQSAELAQQRFELEQKNMAIQQQVASLEEEQATLLATSQRRQLQYDALVQNLSKEVEQGQLQVRQYRNMLAVDLAEQIFFDSGRATLKTGGKEVLQKVGEALKGYDNKVIRVVGHTDNVQISKALQEAFPTNWELSVARATNVVRFLQDVGISPERMVASGRGEYDPVAPNETAEGRQKNRRIEIMLIDQSLANEMERSIN
ncbi:MAG: OmpA family protein [Gallionella sp.]